MHEILYRAYGSWISILVKVSISHSTTSSRMAGLEISRVFISCSAIILFSKSVWIALCCVSGSKTRLSSSLDHHLDFGKMWWLLKVLSLLLIARKNNKLKDCPPTNYDKDYNYSSLFHFFSISHLNSLAIRSSNNFRASISGKACL